MAGCFGNDPVDKWMEQQLYDYLSTEQELVCPKCGAEGNVDEWEFDEGKLSWVCPECGEYFR